MEVKTTGAGAPLSSVRRAPLSPPIPPQLSWCLSSHQLLFSSSVSSLQNGVVHRDLKLENILLDDNCNIKVKLTGPGYCGWVWPVGVASQRPASGAATPSAGRQALGKTPSNQLSQTV